MKQPVEDDDQLLRRVPDRPELWTTRADGTTRPSSAAMKPSTDDGALSVDIRRLLEDPSVPTSVLGGETTYGLAELVAKVPRDIGLQVEHSPSPNNEAHADIRGLYEMTKAAAKRARTTLADKAVWIQMPAGALGPP